jgi:hypothetical protein
MPITKVNWKEQKNVELKGNQKEWLKGEKIALKRKKWIEHVGWIIDIFRKNLIF